MDAETQADVDRLAAIAPAALCLSDQERLTRVLDALAEAERERDLAKGAMVAQDENHRRQLADLGLAEQFPSLTHLANDMGEALLKAKGEAEIAQRERDVMELRAKSAEALWKSALAGAQRERDEARAYGERLYRECSGNARDVACAWCGHQYAGGTPRSQNEALVEHANVCEKHPLRQAEAEVARLRAALEEIAKIECARRDRAASRGVACKDLAAWPCGSCQARAALAAQATPAHDPKE